MTQGTEKKTVTFLFRELMKDYISIKLDPHNCIPFLYTRQITKLGVLCMVALFTRKENKTLDFCGAGIVLRSDAPIVVRPGSHILHLVIKYFVLQRNSHTKAKVRMGSKQTFYRIVDGVHRHAIVLHFIKTETTWRDFMWYVAICKSECSLGQYRHLFVLQSIHYGPSFYLEFTILEFLVNLRMEYNNFKSCTA